METFFSHLKPEMMHKPPKYFYSLPALNTRGFKYYLQWALENFQSIFFEKRIDELPCYPILPFLNDLVLIEHLNQAST